MRNVWGSGMACGLALALWLSAIASGAQQKKFRFKSPAPFDNAEEAGLRGRWLERWEKRIKTYEKIYEKHEPLLTGGQHADYGQHPGWLSQDACGDVRAQPALFQTVAEQIRDLSEVEKNARAIVSEGEKELDDNCRRDQERHMSPYMCDWLYWKLSGDDKDDKKDTGITGRLPGLAKAVSRAAACAKRK